VKKTSVRERETEKRRTASPAAEKQITKRERGGRSNVQPSAFLLYCRISGDFNQGSLSSLSLSLSLCFAIARSRRITLFFPFSCARVPIGGFGCKSSIDNFSTPRERETLELSTIILYDGKLQLVARANKTLRQHRKRNFEIRRYKTNQPSWRKQTNTLGFVHSTTVIAAAVTKAFFPIYPISTWFIVSFIFPVLEP
jgi:hypothetical protein